MKVCPECHGAGYIELGLDVGGTCWVCHGEKVVPDDYKPHEGPP